MDHSQNTMTIWRKGRVAIYPHLEFGMMYTYEELCKIARNIKTELFGDIMTIYQKNSYCYEVNGSWNICFSINILEPRGPRQNNNISKRMLKLKRRRFMKKGNKLKRGKRPSRKDTNGRNYTYMIRRDNGTGKSYGCPFENYDYGDILHYSFNDNILPNELKKLEDYLISTLYRPKKIDCFLC
jgi:hypothetical protein